MMNEALGLLRKYFGYDAFKPGQAEVIEGILQGRDTLAILPTGGGKSLCYQLPTLMHQGITLVISPLISLMKDQVDALNNVGIPTAFINSTMTRREINRTLDEVAQHHYKIVYTAPERLETEEFSALMRRMHIPLIAVDEAHCISQWGHDFRPSYTQINRWINQLPERPIVAAFTATATDRVKVDIVEQLQLRDPQMIKTGYSRDNLTFSVVKGASKKEFLKQYVQANREQSGIIYAATRKEVEELSTQLRALGLRAGHYHAGMSDKERTDYQERFLYDDIKVMVATNAFGMGIDKSNVRYVLHYSMPKNLEAYYQEAGRAGRDGLPGECVLLFAPQDIVTQKFLIENGTSNEVRQASELSNLRLMIGYCHTQDCLQRYIVRYFGDEDYTTCGKCGNCTDDREAVDVTVTAQKIFSCIRRMRERFGVTMVAKVLKGSKDQKVRQFHFDQLPTYGLLASYTEKEIIAKINVLTADGYLEMSDGQYPILTLTPLAIRVLAGQEQVFQKETLRVRQPVMQGSALFEKLREARRQLASELRVPPFTIFHDSTLHELASRRPSTEQEMLDVKGIGELKYQKYGERFLAIIVADDQEVPSTS